jgi:DNA-binding IclR family transcriptional regulator
MSPGRRVALVLDALRDAGPMAVTDLVARTRLSRPTVDAVADDLVRLGWLVEVDPETVARRAARSWPSAATTSRSRRTRDASGSMPFGGRSRVPGFEARQPAR